MTQELPEFLPFPKIARLRREVWITEKIDGSNATIYIPEDDGPILAGSRTRWITPQDDNFGFARWVQDNAETLKKSLGYGLHRGEWWGAGIQRRYDLKEKRFSLFNSSRWETAPELCHTVPVLYRGVFSEDAINQALHRLRTEGSVAAPGFMRPEGIVVYHAAADQLFKVTLEKDEEPKGKSGA